MKQSSSKSGLFLMELIIAVVFFAVASGICIRLFAGAHLTSTRSGDLAMATTIAQNAAEDFKADSAAFENEMTDASQAAFQQMFFSAEGGRIGPNESPEAVYRMVYSFEGEGGMRTVRFSVFKISNVPGEFQDALCDMTVNSYNGEAF